ncbi:GL14548 [Drosophila persimilis]|uniref:GL14548 n=1 Tax=Drosophila persimilis TaxID=7234 RepID=B4GW30_DROPE|nr:GL14548 [Drosophila persimilis]
MERAGVGHQRMLPIPPVNSRHSGGFRNRPIVQAWVQQENDRNLIRSSAVPMVHTQSRHADPRNIESVGAVQDWQHLRNIEAPPPRYEEYIFAAQHAGGSRQDLRRGSTAEPNMQHSVRHYMPQEVHPRSLHSVEHREHAEVSRVLTIQQAMCGAVSPQYGTVVDHPPPSYNEARAIAGVVTVNEMSSGLGASGSVPVEAGCSTPKRARQVHIEREPPIGEAAASPARGQRHNSSGTLLVPVLSNRVAPRQRRRTSSMPAECPRPQHAEVRQAVKHAEDQGMEYYRLRSFSITSNGVCNLGDSLRRRRSRSNNSVTSGGTSYSGIRYHNRNASGNIIERALSQQTLSGEPPTFKIAMLGSPAVGKSALSFQFTTSDHICGYDLSLEMEYGQKTVSVLVDDVESDIEVVDHPACEMSTEAFCATYDIDLFVVVYSVLDVYSFRNAERVLHYLRENDMLLSRGAILVGNKADLERHRAVPQEMGHKVATEIPCKFIETSAGLCHNVNELLVGVVAQVKLNPQRLSMLSPADLERVNMQSSIQNHRRMHLERQLSMCHSDHGLAPDAEDDPNRPHISLRDILNVGESDLEDSEETEAQRRHRFMTRFELLAANIRNESVRPISPVGKRCSIGTATLDNKVARLQRRAMDDSHLGRRGWARPECRKQLFLFNCNGRVKKMTARTKSFVSSLLRFKASHWLSRRTSSSCTDLFAI